MMMTLPWRNMSLIMRKSPVDARRGPSYIMKSLKNSKAIKDIRGMTDEATLSD